MSPTERNHERAPGQMHTSISLDETLWTEVKALATKENRTFSNYVKTVLERCVREKAPAYGEVPQSAPLPSRGGNAAQGARSGMQDCPAMNKLKKHSSRVS